MKSVPRLRFSNEELEQNSPHPDTLLLACQVLDNSGALILENALSQELINRLSETLMTDYARYFQAREYPDALRVGDKRTMISPTMEPPFSSIELYANALILPILRRKLGPECILGSFGAVVALPGAADQHVHRDHPALFANDGLDYQLPSFAINMLVPLIDLSEANSITRVWMGSHRPAQEFEENSDCRWATVPKGGCLLMDYRVLHGGSANRSDTIRPVLYLIYHRPWFRDYVNFKKQPAVRISKAEVELVPPEHRSLFAWLGTGNDTFWESN